MQNELQLAVAAYAEGDRDLAHALFDAWAETQVGSDSDISNSAYLNHPQFQQAPIQRGSAAPQLTDRPPVDSLVQDTPNDHQPLTALTYRGPNPPQTSTSSDLDDDWDFPSASAGDLGTPLDDNGREVGAVLNPKDPKGTLKVSAVTGPEASKDSMIRMSNSGLSITLPEVSVSRLSDEDRALIEAATDGAIDVLNVSVDPDDQLTPDDPDNTDVIEYPDEDDDLFEEDPEAAVVGPDQENGLVFNDTGVIEEDPDAEELAN